MTTRAPFLNTPFGAYYHRDIPEPDTEFTDVGAGTPCGEYLRRFWIPVALSKELKELPLALRILDEELVAFRDQSGRVGVLELHCPHRGASLEFGLVSECGIRCCYHGWLMDIDGRILETPGEPADSTLKDRLRHGAYPVQEYKGLVFTYMGPPEKQPPFPVFDTFEMPGYSAVAMPKYFMAANWLQIKENAMDPAHLDFLHTIDGNIGFSPNLKLKSALEWHETDNGMFYTSVRRVGGNVWVRSGEFLPPILHQFTMGGVGGDEPAYFPSNISRWMVPIDNNNVVTFGFRHVPVGQESLADNTGFGQSDDRPYEDRQRVPGDHDAQCSIHWGTSRHGLEHLATTDRGVIAMRRMIRDGIEAVQRGEDPRELSRTEGGLLPTYGGDTILAIPPAANEPEDRELLRRTAQDVVDEFKKAPRGSRVHGG